MRVPTKFPSSRAVKVLALLSMAVAFAVGCASHPRVDQADRLAVYRSHAGPPVSSFRLAGSLTSWTPLGDGALAVWTRPNEAWLLTLAGSCTDLEFAPAIRLTDSAGGVHARFDRVIPMDLAGTPRQPMPCIIESIRPLDAGAVRAGERELREQPQAPERPQPSGT